MTGSGIMTVAELNLFNVDPYLPLVGKAVRPRLRPLGGAPRVIAFGISDEHGPAGVVVADMAAADSAEIVWLYVVQRLRGRGAGTSLLQAIERRALESGKKCAILMYFPDEETGGLEDFLSASGWTILTSRLTIFCINARIKQAPWFDRWTIPKVFEVFPWIERTDRDRDSLPGIISKIPEILRPSRYEHSFDPNTSIGLRRNGRIMGWLLTRQAGPKTLFYNAMFVHEELQGTGLAFAMVAEAVRREIEVYGPDSVGVIAASQGNPAMMRLINGRLAPYIVWKREAAGAERQLRSCGGR